MQLQVTFLQTAGGQSCSSAETQCLKRTGPFCAECFQLRLPAARAALGWARSIAGVRSLTRGMDTLAELGKLLQSSET